jgi:hypothetical protein
MLWLGIQIVNVADKKKIILLQWMMIIVLHVGM